MERTLAHRKCAQLAGFVACALAGVNPASGTPDMERQAPDSGIETRKASIRSQGHAKESSISAPKSHRAGDAPTRADSRAHSVDLGKHPPNFGWKNGAQGPGRINKPVPRNDSCASPQELIVDGPGEVEVIGTTAGAADDDYGMCQSETRTGRDVVYLLRLCQGGFVDISVTATEYHYRPVFFVRTQCAVRESELIGGCAWGIAEFSHRPPIGPWQARLQLAGLPPGEYYIWVDGETSPLTGDGSLVGAFSLKVRTYP